MRNSSHSYFRVDEALYLECQNKNVSIRRFSFSLNISMSTWEWLTEGEFDDGS